MCFLFGTLLFSVWRYSCVLFPFRNSVSLEPLCGLNPESWEIHSYNRNITNQNRISHTRKKKVPNQGTQGAQFSKNKIKYGYRRNQFRVVIVSFFFLTHLPWCLSLSVSFSFSLLFCFCVCMCMCWICSFDLFQFRFQISWHCFQGACGLMK